MNEDIIADLESYITNIGTDKVWKKTIGTKTFWFSPIPYSSQLKINEVIGSEDLGQHIVAEAKRTTLAAGIVGFEDTDLRPFRHQKVFTIQKEMPRDERKKQGGGKLTMKVDLAEYIRFKIDTWDSEYVDLIFEVFADIMESNRKEILDGVVFENARTPSERLRELEDQVASLRLELKLPPLVEATEIDLHKASPDYVEEELTEEIEETESVSNIPFDPFETIEEEIAPPPSVQRGAPTTPAPPPFEEFVPEISQQSLPVPQIQLPSPIQVAMNEKIKQKLRNAQIQTGNTPDTAYVANPSIPNEVVEQPASGKSPVTPPRINPKQGLNPRFNPIK